jgi:hypothetical protein
MATRSEAEGEKKSEKSGKAVCNNNNNNNLFYTILIFHPFFPFTKRNLGYIRARTQQLHTTADKRLANDEL